MIGFPGIGLEFERNPAILRISDSFALTWYGLIIAVGFLLAVMFCLRQTKHFGLKQDEVIDMLFFATPAGIIGARLYYVAFNWAEFSYDPVKIVKTWEGGMAIYGAVIAAVIAAGLFCWVRHINIGAMLDVGAMGLLIGQAVGRWGNFVNGEVYGKTTDLPWRMSVYGAEVHPLFLYESLWNMLGLLLLYLIMKKRKYNGQMFTIYMAWYGLGRGLMEGMRDAEFNLMLGNFKVSQLLAFVSFIAALLLLFYMTLFRKHRPLLAWTAARDEYDEFRKARKSGGAQEMAEDADIDEGEPEEDEFIEDNEEEGTEEDGGDSEREDDGGEGQE